MNPYFYLHDVYDTMPQYFCNNYAPAPVDQMFAIAPYGYTTHPAHAGHHQATFHHPQVMAPFCPTEEATVAEPVPPWCYSPRDENSQIGYLSEESYSDSQSEFTSTDSDGSTGDEKPMIIRSSVDYEDTERRPVESAIKHIQPMGFPILTTEGRKFGCEFCGRRFTQESNLKAHKRIHTGDKPYRCSICHRSFAQRSSLVTHKRTHTGEKPFPCTFCPKQFADSSTLTKHLRTHTGFKPYECTVCTARFTQSGNLKRHLKTHGYGSQEKVGTEYVIAPDWRGEMIMA